MDSCADEWHLVGMTEEQQTPEDLQTANFRQGDSRPAEVNGDISEHMNGSDLRTGKEKQSGSQLEGGVASAFYINNPKKIVDRQSPPSLKAMADRNSSDTHSASLPKVRHDDDAIPSQFSWPGISAPNPEKVIDTLNHNHQLQSTLSMPVWMPSVVATTISEDAEEQAFENIGDISLDELRDDVDSAYSPPVPVNRLSSGMVF